MDTNSKSNLNSSEASAQSSRISTSSNANEPCVFTTEGLSHFKVIDIIGKGGVGAVYRAEDIQLQRFVAIKMLQLNELQTNIITEARMISKLNHHNIVTVYDIARDQDANFIVMEWVNGLTLDAVTPTEGLPLLQVFSFAKQLASALQCAHKAGVIHRDIKPKNIMVDQNDTIKVLDFGIAMLQQKGAVAAELPQQQAFSGTPQYMAPEQFLGERVDHRSDLFALGIVLFEMLAGRKPFLGFDVAQISTAIFAGERPSLNQLKPDLPVKLVACIDRLLAVQPEQRYQSAASLLADLEAIEQQFKQKSSWWYRQPWYLKLALATPLVATLSWVAGEVIFPPSAQELIQRQLLESKKIAFLPFDNISGDPVLQVFTDGVAAMLSNDLAEVGYRQGDGSAWVLPANAVRRMDNPDVAAVYDEYGVDLVVTGSIQHMGTTRSVNLTLLNGPDGLQLRSTQLTIEADQLFEAQLQIRQSVLALIGWRVPAELAETFTAQRPVIDGAYQQYLNGQGYLYRFDHDDNIERAVAAFEHAIVLAPDYADAYVGLAQAQLKQFLLTRELKHLELMASATARLEKLQASHAALPYLQAEMAFNRGMYAESVPLFEQSIELKPSFASAYIGLSNAFVELGFQQTAETTLLNAQQKMPNNISLLANLGAFYLRYGDYQQALNFFQLQALQAPNNYTAYLNISACHYLLGDYDGAIAAAEKSLEIEQNADVYANVGTIYFTQQKYQQAVTAYEKMIRLNDTDFVNWGNLADAYRFADNSKYRQAFEKAIELAEIAYRTNPNDKYVITSLAYYYANLANEQQTHVFAKRISKDDLGEDIFQIAAAYTRLGLNQLALEYLALAMDNNYSVVEVESSVLLEPLRQDPAYLELLQRVKSSQQ